MIGYIILFFILAIISAAIWPTRGPRDKEYTDKALGIGRKKKRHKWQ